ncbi:hypothetical protein [Terrimonas alba]|uniref:hypothetical protein n=1 Tax=Terrimonas alba TaxID=3349636 RepID=UPI0035F30221
MENVNFKQLLEFMKRIPAIKHSIATGVYDNQNWWLKFSIDIEDELAWNVVQEFGHIINYLSLNERLPVVFYPASAPPYLNGGPKDFLYWIIESNSIDFTPQDLKEWLEGRLPDPVDDIKEWTMDV